jgi:hypothetical protein
MTTKPRFTFKKYAEYLLIVWVFLITIDVGQTMYAFTFYGSQITEANPLGYPLGIVFVVCLWFTLVSLNEFISGSSPYLCISVPVLLVGSIFAIVNNFMVLMRL